MRGISLVQSRLALLGAGRDHMCTVLSLRSLDARTPARYVRVLECAPPPRLFCSTCCSYIGQSRRKRSADQSTNFARHDGQSVGVYHTPHETTRVVLSLSGQ